MSVAQASAHATPRTVHLSLWLLLALSALVPHAMADDWIAGRATFYGNDGGATIDQGSCMYGHLDFWQGTGWDIAAMADTDPAYGGSCGRCYEVGCRPGSFKDHYGNWVDRSGTCLNPDTTVVVRITDTCPCNYPSNAYSNKRWCCGDMPHLDLSYTAFQKLGRTSDGVMAARWRPVTCPNCSTAVAWNNRNGGSTSASAYASSSGSGNAFSSSSSSSSWSGSSASASAWSSSAGRK